MIATPFKNYPKFLTIALSGGIDSVVTDHYFSQCHVVERIYVNHGSAEADLAEEFVRDTYKNVIVRKILEKKPSGRSWEDWWREKRYQLLENRSSKFLVTGHTLDDAVETWIFKCLHGHPSMMNVYIKDLTNPIIRPMILTSKDDIKVYADQNDLQWCEDQSNSEDIYMRNIIRNRMMSDVLRVNPGIRKTIFKKIYEEQMGNRKIDLGY